MLWAFKAFRRAIVAYRCHTIHNMQQQKINHQATLLQLLLFAAANAVAAIRLRNFIQLAAVEAPALTTLTHMKNHFDENVLVSAVVITYVPFAPRIVVKYLFIFSNMSKHTH